MSTKTQKMKVYEQSDSKSPDIAESESEFAGLVDSTETKFKSLDVSEAGSDKENENREEAESDDNWAIPCDIDWESIVKNNPDDKRLWMIFGVPKTTDPCRPVYTGPVSQFVANDDTSDSSDEDSSEEKNDEYLGSTRMAVDEESCEEDD